MPVTVHDRIDDIAAEDWNRLAGTVYPFLRHEFLRLAEQTGCVSPRQGWTPRHLTLVRRGKIVGAMPLYEKSHSWGEFVFDWAWANAYAQAGFEYYPKLVSAVPFTPAPSRRLLLDDPGDEETAMALLDAAIRLADDSGCSSLHVLFPTADEAELLRSAGMLIRNDCQFHWKNRGYAGFDDFLATFTSAKRRKARRDRRRVREHGIRFRRCHGAEMSATDWTVVYTLISRTFMLRGSLPYFNLEFLRGLGAEQPDNVLVIFAEKDDVPVAAAVFFESDTALYGRYWGSDGHYDALHFETCYYQGIDYCIERDIAVFEPGTQGEHKVSRGFAPVTTWSAHWLAHPEFASAIERYLDHEARHVRDYMDEIDARSPYKAGGPSK